jgi:protein O-mannosyl-transferase
MKTIFDRQFGMVALLLVGLTLAAYWPVFDAGFVNYDDKDYVTENPQVLVGLTWTGVKWAFTTDLMGSWHPLTWLSHMADVQFFGADPTGSYSICSMLSSALPCFGR